MHWEILRKCISERAKLQNFTEFHGKLPISRKTFHFAVRVTAVKSRNRLGLRYNVPPCPHSSDATAPATSDPATCVARQRNAKQRTASYGVNIWRYTH